MRHAILLTLLATLALAGARAEGVAFKTLSGEETGLKAIMEKWKADELARQGGKFGDHGWWPWGLLAFDYDRDGAVDLLAQQHGAPQSIVIRSQFKEKGTLTFVNMNPALGLPSNGLSGCFKPTAMDIDGDGFPDLIYNDAMPNTVYFNREGKKFEPMGMGFGQLDHVRDLFEVSPEGYPNAGNEKIRYTYDPSAKRYKSQPVTEGVAAKPPAILAAFVAELKKDPKNRFLHLAYFERVNVTGQGRDLCCGGFASYGGAQFGRYLHEENDGTWTDATEKLGLPKDATPILLADFNRDGIDDVLATGAGLYLSDGKGGFALKPGGVTDYLKNIGAYLHKAFPVDFNNDGEMDLVLNNPRRSSVEIFENVGKGEFKSLAKTGAWDADPVSICDIDHNGLMDVCVGGPAETITIFLNQSPNPGHGVQIYPCMDKPNPFAVGARVEIFRAGDLDKPGARPVASAWANSNGLPVHAGLGKDAAFDLKIVFPGKEPRTVALKGLAADRRLKVTPDGTVSELK
ncbi:MAG: CRTAC1 family protein [Planctomycetota bacterium]|nr:CRTAC1 family protein [Planctomycetota bacterium]